MFVPVDLCLFYITPIMINNHLVYETYAMYYFLYAFAARVDKKSVRYFILRIK